MDTYVVIIKAIYVSEFSFGLDKASQLCAPTLCRSESETDYR